jgi:hypothetical protein
MTRFDGTGSVDAKRIGAKSTIWLQAENLRILKTSLEIAREKLAEPNSSRLDKQVPYKKPLI